MKKFARVIYGFYQLSTSEKICKADFLILLGNYDKFVVAQKEPPIFYNDMRTFCIFLE